MESMKSYRANTIPLKIITFANKFFRAYMEGNFMLINIFEGILIPFVGTTLERV